MPPHCVDCPRVTNARVPRTYCTVLVVVEDRVLPATSTAPEGDTRYREAPAMTSAPRVELVLSNTAAVTGLEAKSDAANWEKTGTDLHVEAVPAVAGGRVAGGRHVEGGGLGSGNHDGCLCEPGGDRVCACTHCVCGLPSALGDKAGNTWLRMQGWGYKARMQGWDPGMGGCVGGRAQCVSVQTRTHIRTHTQLRMFLVDTYVRMQVPEVLCPVSSMVDMAAGLDPWNTANRVRVRNAPTSTRSVNGSVHRVVPAPVLALTRTTLRERVKDSPTPLAPVTANSRPEQSKDRADLRCRLWSG